MNSHDRYLRHKVQPIKVITRMSRRRVRDNFQDLGHLRGETHLSMLKTPTCLEA
jgi:hypothetical protein